MSLKSTKPFYLVLNAVGHRTGMPLENRLQQMSPPNCVSIILLLPFAHFYLLQLPEEMNRFQGNGGSGDYKTGVTRPSSSFSSYGY